MARPPMPPSQLTFQGTSLTRACPASPAHNSQTAGTDHVLGAAPRICNRLLRGAYSALCGQCLCYICSLHIGKPPWRGGSWLMGPPACSLRLFPQQNLRVCRMNQCLTNSQLGWGIQSALLLTPVQLFALKSRRTCGCEDNKALKPDWRTAHVQM